MQPRSPRRVLLCFHGNSMLLRAADDCENVTHVKKIRRRFLGCENWKASTPYFIQF